MRRRGPAALMVFLAAFASSGCGFHHRRHAQFDGAQARSVIAMLPRETYDTIRVRPDMLRERSASAESFVLTLPDGSVNRLADITPEKCAGLSEKVAGVSCSTSQVGPDNAAHYWNNFASGASRLAVAKPPRLIAEAIGTPGGPKGDFVVCGIRYAQSVQHKASFFHPSPMVQERNLCHYVFWFERGRCVQMEVTTVDRHPEADGFVPYIGVRSPAGERSYRLPVSEADLTQLFGARRSSLVTG